MLASSPCPCSTHRPAALAPSWKVPSQHLHHHRTSRVRPRARAAAASGLDEWFQQASRKAQAAWHAHDVSGKVQHAAKAAQKAGREAFDQAQEAARRTWQRLDSQHHISERAQRAARRAGEVARDLDQKYNVQRRLRNSTQHAQRMLPVWARQFEQFAGTSHGKLIISLALLFIMTSSWFWRLLNLAMLLMWALVPLSYMALGAFQKQQQQQQQQEEEAARQQEADWMRNPFANMFWGSQPGSGGSSRASKQQGRGSGGSSSKRSSSSGRRYQQDGPVIDAEYKVIDNDKEKRKK